MAKGTRIINNTGNQPYFLLIEYYSGHKEWLQGTKREVEDLHDKYFNKEGVKFAFVIKEDAGIHTPLPRN